MYLDRLSLKNFKCFSDQELTLSKITLLLGANSTGKSTLIYSLLAALQSDQFPLTLSANGALVTLGDFRAISYLHRPDHHVTIGLMFGGHQLGVISFRGIFESSPKTGMPQMTESELGSPTLSLKVTKDDKYKADWKYDNTRDPLQKMRESSSFKKLFQAFAEISKELSKKNKQGLAAEQPYIEDFFGIPPENGSFSFASPSEFFKRLGSPRYVRLGPHLALLTNSLVEFQRGFNYLGSFRLEPQRTYYQVSKGNLKVERNGTNYIEQINAWEEKKASELNQLKRSLRSLGLLSNIRTTRLRSGMFELSVRTSKTAVPVSLADVGFGIGQLLPILVADLQLPRGGTLAISQPEIHLHPSVQADIAEYFVNRALSKRSRYIIETHSEYFLNRLRLLVAQGKLSPDDLSILYLSQDGTQIKSHKIKFNPDGRIEGAPKDFFQTYMLDVMNIAIEAKA
jgi:hypothetical protein